MAWALSMPIWEQKLQRQGWLYDYIIVSVSCQAQAAALWHQEVMLFY